MANEVEFLKDLKRFLNHDNAFGPEHFGAIGVENLRIFERLFDSENKIYSRMSFKTPLVIGRRGSGKSTFLQSRKISEKTQKQVVVEINSGSLFSAIAKRIHDDHQDDYVEVIADTWTVIFDFCLLVAIGGEYGAPQQLVTLNTTFRTKYRDAYKRRGTSTTGRLIHYFEDFTKDMLSQIKADVRSWTNTSIADLREVAMKFLSAVDRKAVCLIDSLEEYKLTKNLNTDSLAGLFKCTGEYHASRGGVMQIHVSVPSELYSFFTGYISRGVIKDFSNATWLYWHASELLSICAKRLHVFLHLYGIPGWEFLDLRKLNDKKECMKFLAGFFPETIQTSSGAREDPIAYLLRHTQLIPRHIITILNQVHTEQVQINRNGTFKFSELALKNAVERKITEITEDIIVGYREKYPNLQQVLEAIIPNLPLQFTDPEIDSQFPRHVKALHKTYPKVIDYAIDSTTLLRTLLDVGVVGRVIDETNIYTKAEFSYTIPSRDVGFNSEMDKFCFHPAFAKRFRCIYDRKFHKPIYPIGTDPEAELFE